VSDGGPERPPIALVGGGRAARRLALALREHAWPVAGLASRTPERAAVVAADIGVVALGSAEKPQPELARAPITVIAVSDDAVEPVALALARTCGPWPGRTVLHVSGSLPSSVLEPLRARGASVGSWHPLATLKAPEGPRDRAGVPPGIPFFIEGDPEARAVARSLTLALLGEPHELRGSDAKAAYHAAATLAGNLVAVLFAEAAALLGSLGIEHPERVLAPLAQASLEGAIAHAGLASLTGPVVRGDVATLRRNVDGLRGGEPELREAHAALSLLALRRLRDVPGRDAAKDAAMEALLCEVLRDACPR
jgi:predicted short-subunit dehydrogenase-like oxidoreductase (DUF2520 family)